MKKMQIKLYDYLMSILRFCNMNDTIIIKSDTFFNRYDNIYQILDEIHLTPTGKNFYKDYNVYNVLIETDNHSKNGHRKIYISVEL